MIGSPEEIDEILRKMWSTCGAPECIFVDLGMLLHVNGVKASRHRSFRIMKKIAKKKGIWNVSV